MLKITTTQETRNALPGCCLSSKRWLMVLFVAVFSLSDVMAQSPAAHGKVTDDKGAPLPGVNIIIKGTATGRVTDSLGSYSIPIPDSKTVLIFSFIGFVKQEVPAKTNTSLDIRLIPDARSLNSVVVVGYGTQKRANLTGSVATISGSELLETPTNNLTNAIGGRLPGVVTMNGNGRPGQGSSIQIRGFSTLNDNSPLYVIDGIVRSDGFANIDPNEVASITVLKDASSAAVYGARAANGVILVTTRRGTTGKPVITYSGLFGTQNYTRYPRMMSAYEYASKRNEALRNMGYDPANPAQAGQFYTDEELEGFKPGVTDWYKLVFKKNNMQSQHNLNVSGGTDAIHYFASLGYADQDGMYNNINFKRFNFRTNVDAKINKDLKVGLNLEGRQEMSNTPGYDANTIFNYIQLIPPTFPAYTKSGRPFNNDGAHPVEMVNNSGYGNNQWTVFQGTLFLDQRLDFITQGLSVRATGSYYKQHLFNKTFFIPHKMYNEDDEGNITNVKTTGGVTSLSEQFQEINNVTLNASLNYARTFGKHDLSGLVLYEQYSSKGNGFNAARQDFSTNIKDELFASGPANQTIGGSGLINDARRSVVGRVNYAYNNKYLLEGTFRYDGSFRFPPEERFGFFPAFSAGWRMSEEPFFKNSSALEFISDLKLRASNGVIGNDRVSPYQYADAYSITTNAGPIVDGQALPYVAYGVYPNPGITWEKQKNTNFGLDAMLFKSRLGVELDYFFRNTTDILWSRSRSVPGTFGRSLPNENYAAMKSSGFEFTISYQNSIKGFDYNVRLMGSYANNTVTAIDDPSNALDYQKQLNRPYGYQYGYKSLGLFQSQEEADKWYGGDEFGYNPKAGDIKYADVDGDGRITLADQQVLADYGGTPRMMYGFSAGFKWKNFDLNFLVQGAAQRKIFLGGGSRVMFLNSSYNNYAYLDDAWSPENKGAKYPEAWLGANVINDRNSDFWLRNAGYARLKSLDIGYSFNVAWLKEKKIQRLRLYVSGLNLFTISQLKEFDPEAETGGGWYYPQQKSMNIGINLSF